MLTNLNVVRFLNLKDFFNAEKTRDWRLHFQHEVKRVDFFFNFVHIALYPIKRQKVAFNRQIRALAVGQIKTLPFSIAVVPMIVCYQIHILIIVEDLADVLTHFLIAVLEWELLVVFIRLTVERRTDALPDLLFALVRQVIDQMF